MSVQDLRLEVAPYSYCAGEIGTEESNERQLRGPRRCNVVGHVSGVSEALVTTWSVSESLDADAFDFICFRHPHRCGRDDPHRHVLRAQRDGQSKYEGAGCVAL